MQITQRLQAQYLKAMRLPEKYEPLRAEFDRAMRLPEKYEAIRAEFDRAMRLPEKYEAISAEIKRALRPLTISPEDQDRLQIGIDLVSVFCPGPDRTGADRVASAERVVDRLPYIVHSRKLGVVRAALGNSAPGHEELRYYARQGIFEAIQELAYCHPSDLKNLNRLAALLSRRITEDLLGPKWHRRYGPTERTVERNGRKESKQLPFEVPEADIDTSVPAQGYQITGRRNGMRFLTEARDTVSWVETVKDLLQNANLTKKEQDLVEALIEHEGCIKDAALALGISASTASVHLHNIRKKIAADI